MANDACRILHGITPDVAPLADPAQLRRRAEHRAQALKTEEIDASWPAEAQRVLHELRVHQIELEMQNEELRAIRERLELSQARYFDLYALAPVGYLTLSEPGVILEANLTAAVLLGVDRVGLPGKPLSAFIVKDDQDNYYHLMTRLKTGQPQTCELRLKKRDNPPFWARLEAAAAPDESGPIVWRVVISDVTENKQAKDAVQEALQQLKLITDNMAAGVTRCSRDLKYMWVSPSYAAWLGRKGPEEIVGRTIIDVRGPDLYEAVRPYVRRVLSGERVEFEIQAPYPGTGPRWIHAVYVPTRGKDHNVDGWIGVVTDITERHEAEERLRESEERFRRTFYQAAVGIAQTGIDGQWLLLNDRLCEILGYSRDELRGKTFIDITHPDDRQASLAGVRKLLAGELTSFSLEKRYIHKDGAMVWARLYTSLMRDQYNEPRYFISVVEDITEKVHAERALRESRRELRALAGRLINAQEEERRRISRQLHDDFSQRLALLAIDTPGLLDAPSPSPDQMKETLRNIHSRIVQMSADLRRISHELHPSILEDLGLAAALREMCEEFSAREGIEATLEQGTMPESLPKEAASCLYWIAHQALHNISKHAHASHVRASLGGSPQGVQLCIQDDGAGFDPEAGRGHGLGIISMRERVRIVRGELSIHSQPGQGTEVKAFVPLTKESLPGAGLKPRAS
jgi:PAS domain S-box-containing protein